MFPEENALERLAGDVAREVVHDHDVGHTLELAGHPGVDPLHEPAHADGARPSEDGRRGRRLPPPRVLASEDRHLTHRRVLDRNLLDVPRLDVHASPR